MEAELKQAYKTEFKSHLDEFCKELDSFVSTDANDWTIKGFIDVYKNIYTISADTKIVSKILEIHIFPQILLFAKRIGYKILLADKQNYYPDLTFINISNEEVIFAVDIKTTYRNNNESGFTLGSHGSYFKERDKKKNIQLPYNMYLGHYCLGIIYTRVESEKEVTDIYQVKDLQEEGEVKAPNVGIREVKLVSELNSITSVIRDFDFFAAEKWKISSDRQGSGNTANIGSISNLEDLKNENGTFCRLGEDYFDEYWMNYGNMYKCSDGNMKAICSIVDFLKFKNRDDLIELVTNRTKKVKKIDNSNNLYQLGLDI